MSLKTQIMKTAFSIALTLKCPSAIVIPAITNGIVEYFADMYDSSTEEREKQITKKTDKLFARVFSEEFFRDKKLDYDKLPLYQSQIQNVLEFTPFDAEILALYKNDVKGLCSVLVEKYEECHLKDPLEEVRDIELLLGYLLPPLIRIISSDTETLFEYVLQIAEKMHAAEVEVNKLKQFVDEFRSEKRMDYPVFVTDLPFSLCDYFLGREEDVDYLYEQVCCYQKLILFGIGGIGKTEIAKKVIFRILREPVEKHGYEAIAWIDYDNTDIRKCIARSLV